MTEPKVAASKRPRKDSAGKDRAQTAKKKRDPQQHPNIPQKKETSVALDARTAGRSFFKGLSEYIVAYPSIAIVIFNNIMKHRNFAFEFTNFSMYSISFSHVFLSSSIRWMRDLLIWDDLINHFEVVLMNSETCIAILQVVRTFDFCGRRFQSRLEVMTTFPNYLIDFSLVLNPPPAPLSLSRIP